MYVANPCEPLNVVNILFAVGFGNIGKPPNEIEEGPGELATLHLGVGVMGNAHAFGADTALLPDDHLHDDRV